jgi:hypothetical protein
MGSSVFRLSSSRRFGTACLALLAALLFGRSAFAAPGKGATQASRAGIDIAAFERLASAHDHVTFRGIVAADIDRDGDIDVVAATERGLMVWKNDGFGHLVRERPKRPPVAVPNPPEHAWKSTGQARDESVQDDLPSATELAARAHDPPPTACDRPVCTTAAARPEASGRRSSPRAPPA